MICSDRSLLRDSKMGLRLTSVRRHGRTLLVLHMLFEYQLFVIEQRNYGLVCRTCKYYIEILHTIDQSIIPLNVFLHLSC